MMPDRPPGRGICNVQEAASPFPQNAPRTSKRSLNTDNPVYVGIYRPCLLITTSNAMVVVLIVCGLGRRVGLGRFYRSSYGAPRADCGPPIIIRVSALAVLAFINTPQEQPL